MDNQFELKDKPVWQMTGEELLLLLGNSPASEPEFHQKEKKYVYGLRGIAELFDCSICS